MATLMEHPRHGRHYASGHEIESMKANGWLIVIPPVVLDQVQPVKPVEPVELKKLKKPNQDMGL